MTETEEKMLRRDAVVNRDRAAEMPRSRLDSTVRKGIMRGKVRARRRNVFYASGGVIAVVAALLLTLAVLRPGGNILPDEKVAAQRDWGAFEVFRGKNGIDPMLVGALNRGEVKPIDKTVEKNGYTVTLQGVAADSRSMILLYSVTNGNDQAAIVDGDTVEYDAGSRGASSASEGSATLQPGQTDYRVLSVLKEEAVPESSEAVLKLVFTTDTPEAMLSSSRKYRTESEVSFEMDGNALAAKERVWEYDRVLNVEDQEIRILRTVATPIATYVDIAYGEANTKQIFGLIRPRLLMNRNGQNEEIAWSGSYGMASSDGALTLQFAGHIPQDAEADSIRLAIDGISALEPDRLKLVVDTDKMEVLEAPDSAISVESAESTHNAGYIAIKRIGVYPEGMASNMLLDSTFVDGEGFKHNLESETPGGEVSYSATDSDGEKQMTFEYVYIGQQKWPQPLTFSITNYPNPILLAAQVSLD